VDLDPAGALVLVKLHEDCDRDPVAVAKAYGVDRERTQAALRSLTDRGWIAPADGTGRFCLTPAGCGVLGRLVEARRARLAELVSDWPADQRVRMAGLLRRIAQELVPDAPGERTP
jgi:DNA-binding IclR family transcriptional regulator